MTDDTQPKEETIQSHPHEEAHETTPASAQSAAGLSPVVVLGLVVIALLGALVVLLVRNGRIGPDVTDEDVARAKANLSAYTDDLNRQRAALGLPPKPSMGESAEDIAARLKKDADTMASLVASFQGMLAQKDAELESKSREMLSSEQLVKTLNDQLARLKSELSSALVNGVDLDRMKAEIERMKSQRDALAAELANRKNAVPDDQLAALQSRVDALLVDRDEAQRRIRDLEAQLAKGKLFASSEKELLPAAVALFKTLRELEGKPDADINQAYSEFGVRLGAHVLTSLKFPTGSSELSDEDRAAIRALVPDVADGDMLFVVGYASETGNIDANRVLSSDRATAAAEYFSSVKNPGQNVQAVYLGQTDRFSSRYPERNQIVELWAIQKR